MVAALISFGAPLAARPPAQSAGGGTQDHVAALRQAMQAGQARIRQYEWIETTTIALKGEEKGRTQKRCYYGADGKVQKVPVGEAPAEQSGGRRGGKVKQRIVEEKKGEMQDYLERAGNLIHRYVPPDAAEIQSAKDAGRIAVGQPSGGRVHFDVSEYLQPGDSLAIDLDTAANRLIGLRVNTYLDTPEDPVTLTVQMGALPDGAVYAAQTTLDAPAKNVRVVIQNSGHRPAR
jgi:hypothetical protein